MKRNRIFAFLATLLFVAIIGEACPESLVIDRFNGRDPDRSDKAAIRIAISFFPDGLIRSYEEKYYDKEKRTEAIGKSFEVVRDSSSGTESLTQVFSKAGQNPQAFVRIEYSEIILINIVQAGTSGSPIQIRVEKDTPPGSSVYASVSKADPAFVFRFASGENRIEALVTARGRTFKEIFVYSVDSSSGLPKITCQTPDNLLYKTGLLSDRKVAINVGALNGPLDEAFKVEGHLSTSKPVIALINYELLWDDPALGNAIFPYIGGSPR